MNPASHAHRRILLVVITTIAAMFRFTSFGKLGFSHFDEGIYALAGLATMSPEGLVAVKMVAYYSPPGFPILIGFAFGLFGLSDSSAILVSVATGVATIPIVAWLGRRTFGAGAEMASATLAALSMPHIAFSRKALTDVPFLLTWLVAIGLGGWFLEKPRFGRALALGMAAGIAQNFKYNGWLAGALVFLAAFAGPMSHSDERLPSSIGRTFGWGSFAALVSLLFYLPWFRFVERNVGYSSLMEHHRNYVSGVRLWWAHWDQQLDQATALSGGQVWCFLACLLAVGACGLSSNGIRLVAATTWKSVVLSLLLVSIAATAYAFFPSLPWWIGLASTPWFLRSGRPGVRLLGVWWLVLSILTPFYHPYARLWLPMEALGWLIFGGWIARCDAFELGNRARWTIGFMALTIIAMVIHSAWRLPTRPFPSRWVLGPEPTLRRIGMHDLPGDPSFAGKRVRMLARRCLGFYFLLNGPLNLQVEPDFESLLIRPRSNECLVVDAVMVGASRDAEEIAHRLATSWKLERSFRDRLDPITLLDHDPSSARDPTHRVTRNEILLFSPKVLPKFPVPDPSQTARTRTNP